MTETATQEPGTAVEHVERRGFDLTRAPWRQWDKQMVDLMKATVLPKARDDAQVYFCLAVADSLGLNPFAQEVFFIPQRGRDGDVGGVKPYIGREGLVKKAHDRDYYFEADYVCENDRFRMTRTKDGTRTVTHSYTQRADRGDVVGAYAFLWSKDPSVKPAFFYADLTEYLPDLTDEKMKKSPWSEKNQRAAMIVKCAMIGAGRQRLNLSGVMIDAEVDRVMQQGTGTAPPPGQPEDFDYGSIENDDLRERLQAAVNGARDLDPDAWPAAKCEMAFKGRSDDELTTILMQIEQENAEAREKGPVVDAQIVDSDLDELRSREKQLADSLGFAADYDEEQRIRAELDQVRAEIRQRGGDAPGQESLDLS